MPDKEDVPEELKEEDTVKAESKEEVDEMQEDD